MILHLSPRPWWQWLGFQILLHHAMALPFGVEIDVPRALFLMKDDDLTGAIGDNVGIAQENAPEELHVPMVDCRHLPEVRDHVLAKDVTPDPRIISGDVIRQSFRWDEVSRCGRA